MSTERLDSTQSDDPVLQMGLTITFDDTEILNGGTTAALFKCNCLIQNYHSQLVDKLKGKTVTASGFRGTVVSVDKQTVRAKGDDGVEKKLRITDKMVHQLEGATTRRK